MTRGKKILLVGLPLVFLVAWIYPYFPWHNLGLCVVKRMLGLNCPGCGFIRSVATLMHGQVMDSIALNPMGLVAVALLTALWLKEFVAAPLLRKGLELSAQGVKVVSLAFVFGLFIQWFFYLAITFKVALGKG